MNRVILVILKVKVQHMKTTLLIITFVLFGCVARPIVEKIDDRTHSEQNKAITQKIIELANTGDWLVIRGYHATDNLVSNATGIPISHVGLFNSEFLQVIEAEGKGVHFSELNEFVNKSYRLLIIRPRWKTENNSKNVWENAFKLVGKSYDFLGTIGFNYPSKYYCSELAVYVYDEWFTGKEKFPNTIKPGELYLYGTVLYDSLPRDEI
jgi:hypothetical protein